MFKRRAVVFLISDFIQNTGYNETVGGPFSKLMAATSRRHDLMCLCVQDPRERALAAVGHLHFEDPETGDFVEVDTSTYAKAYSAAYESEQGILQKHLKQRGIDFLKVENSQPYLLALKNFLANRRRK
jgi:hypothetical protein